jgi:hypothetical protein
VKRRIDLLWLLERLQESCAQLGELHGVVHRYHTREFIQIVADYFFELA